MDMNIVEARGVRKTYGTGDVAVKALDGVDFTVAEGEFALIVGESGAGKTTVLNVLGGMDTCGAGELLVDGFDIATYNERQLTRYRRNEIGFVFQFYNLIGNLTALENVELAGVVCRHPQDAAEALRAVGLSDRANHFPGGLSGGEQQRVSIARAMAKNPRLLLCDEPTGALDYQTGKQVLAHLQAACREQGKTVIVVTHNRAIAPMADRVIHMKSGKIASIKTNGHPVPVEEIEW